VRSSRELFSENKYGLPSFGFGRRPMVFNGEEELLFGTEALSGWRHLVSLELSGGNVRELRPGHCEDVEWLVSAGWAYLAHNCDELDSRGIERIRLSDGTRQTIVRGDVHTVAGVSNQGWDTRESSPGGMVLTSTHFAWLQSSWDRPLSVEAVLCSSLGEAGGHPIPITHDDDWVQRVAPLLVRPKVVVFPSRDGKFQIHTQVFLPRTPSGAGLVYSHGGSERQAFAAFHFDPTYAQEYAVNQWLAVAHNFTVVSVNYRSGVGYGAAFRLCDGCMANGAKEYEDVLDSTKVLLEQGVDPCRVGIWGLSYGGLNVLQAIARDSAVFAAGASIAGFFNWISADRFTTDTGLAIYNGDIQPLFPPGWRTLKTGPLPHLADPQWSRRVESYFNRAFQSSPAATANNMTSPLLLIQGDADEEVDFEELVGCVRALRAHGIEPEIMVVPDEVHGLGQYEHQATAYRVILSFLTKHLSPKGRTKPGQ